MCLNATKIPDRSSQNSILSFCGQQRMEIAIKILPMHIVLIFCNYTLNFQVLIKVDQTYNMKMQICGASLNCPLPYLLNLGLCYVVLTSPQTRPCMTFLFVGTQLRTRISFRRGLATPPLSSANVWVKNDRNRVYT